MRVLLIIVQYLLKESVGVSLAIFPDRVEMNFPVFFVVTENTGVGRWELGNPASVRSQVPDFARRGGKSFRGMVATNAVDSRRHPGDGIQYGVVGPGPCQ